MKNVSLTDDATGAVASYQLAESYADLTPKARMAVLRLAYCQPKTLQSRLSVLHLSSTIPVELKRHLCQPQHLDVLHRLLDEMEWAWQSGIETRPRARFRHRGMTYYLPDENLRQVGTGEFITAVAYLVAFSADGGGNAEKQTFLNQFLATICRPGVGVLKRLNRDAISFDGDEREPFSSYRIDSRATRFLSIDLAEKVAIMQWFLRATGRMEQLYGMPAPDPGQTPSPIRLGSFVRDWETTAHQLAREQNFGNYDAVMARPIHDVMALLELKKLEIIEQQRYANRHESPGYAFPTG